MELNRKLLSSLALLTAIYCGALATRPAKASLAMEVLANQVMAEEMILDGDTFVPSGTPKKSYMPFSPTLNTPAISPCRPLLPSRIQRTKPLTSARCHLMFILTIRGLAANIM